MITKFINLDIIKHDENDFDVIVDVELQNQAEELSDPSIVLNFKNGEHKGTELLKQGQIITSYIVSEIEKLQTLVYVSKHEKFKELHVT